MINPKNLEINFLTDQGIWKVRKGRLQTCSEKISNQIGFGFREYQERRKTENLKWKIPLDLSEK